MNLVPILTDLVPCIGEDCADTQCINRAAPARPGDLWLESCAGLDGRSARAWRHSVDATDDMGRFCDARPA